MVIIKETNLLRARKKVHPFSQKTPFWGLPPKKSRFQPPPRNRFPKPAFRNRKKSLALFSWSQESCCALHQQLTQLAFFLGANPLAALVRLFPPNKNANYLVSQVRRGGPLYGGPKTPPKKKKQEDSTGMINFWNLAKTYTKGMI